MILVWVDDIIIAASNDGALQVIKKALMNKFKMKDLGQLSWYLGIEFTFNPDGSISMDHRKYCESILKRYHMEDCNPKSIPCDMSVSNMISSDSTELEDPKLYREIVGSLIYVMIGTRPDISYVVTKLSQFLAKPTKSHLNLSKHVLRYIKGTLNFCLKYSKSENPLKLIGYCDSDWGGSEDRRSTSGYCFQLSNQGSLISWKSKKQ